MLTKNEFKVVLEKLNYDKSDNQTVNAIFYLYDPRGQGFLDWRDFHNKFYDYAN